MKIVLVSIAAFGLCFAVIFLPHHRRTGNPFRACTLAEIYRDVMKAIPSLFAPQTGLFFLFAAVGIGTCFYPAMVVLMLGWQSRSFGRAGGGIFIIGGLFALIGAVVNFIAMLVSHMNFTFGGGSDSKDETVFLKVIPIFQIVVALLSIAIGSWAACAELARKLVTS